MNFETLARIKRIEIALDGLKAAVATLEAQIGEIKACMPQFASVPLDEPPKSRPVLRLKKNV